MPIFDKGPNSRRNPKIREMRRKEEQNGKKKEGKKEGNKPNRLKWQD